MEPQEQKPPLTKADFPQDASCHMRDMTPEQRQSFLDWVNGLEYVTDKRWPGVLIAKEKWEWAFNGNPQNLARATTEFNAAAVFSKAFEQLVRMLPEDYNPVKKLKNADSVIQDRTCDFKTSRDVQKAYRDGRHQALDVYITIPAGISLEEAERKVRKAIGSIQKGCNDTGTPCPDFEGSVYFNHYGEKEVRRLAINTAGLTQWDEAHYGGPRIDVEPIDVVPIDVFPIRSPMVNITDKTDLSSNELANTGNAIGCITQQEAPQEQAPAGVAASHGERLHAHPAMSSEPQPRIPTSINITEDSGLSNDNHATGAQSTDCNRRDPMRDAAIEATIDEMCGKFGEVAPDPALIDKAMAKILPEGRKKDAPGDGMDKGRGRGGFSR